MKLDAFLALQAVIRHGTLAAAASEMHLTASAISLQMKQLEAFFGQPLFDRSGPQLRPTPLALEASRVMGEALSRLEGLRETTHLAVAGRVSVGVFETMLPALLPPMLQAAGALHPGLDVKLTSGRTVALTAAVKAGELDAALVARPEDGGSTRLEWIEMEQRRLVLVAPRESEEGSVEALFAAWPWIRYDHRTTSGVLARRYVEQHAPRHRLHSDLDSAAAIVSMVSAGLGVSVLELSEPSWLASYPVRVLPLGEGAPAYPLCLIVRRADRDKRKLKAIAEVLRQALQVAAERREKAIRAFIA